MLLVIVLALLVEVTRAAAGVGAETPTDALKDFFEAVNVVVNDPQTVGRPLDKLRAIRRHVDDVVDFREAAMLALGREWSARSPVEQNEFVALFADLLERSFVWRVAGKASLSGGVRVDYLDETTVADTASVDTRVAGRDGNAISLLFRMVQRDGRWVVRDIVMDGVSTMENYHAQFQRIVRDSAWPDLMGQLRAKVGAPAGVRVAAAAPVAAPPAPPRTSMVLPLAAAAADRSGNDPDPAIAREVVAAATSVRRAVATGPPRVMPMREVTPPREILAAVPAPGGSRSTTPLAPVLPPPRPADRPRIAASPPAGEGAGAAVWIQVGAFKSTATAGRVAAQVDGEILVVPPPGPRAEVLLRVRVGPFPDRARASMRLRELRALGYQPFLAAGD